MSEALRLAWLLTVRPERVTASWDLAHSRAPWRGERSSLGITHSPSVPSTQEKAQSCLVPSASSEPGREQTDAKQIP